MVEVTERHHPLVADFASERLRLSKSEMMRLAGHSPADEAWESRHVFEVLTIPKCAWEWQSRARSCPPAQYLRAPSYSER
jgi:hypothetical protein